MSVLITVPSTLPARARVGLTSLEATGQYLQVPNTLVTCTVAWQVHSQGHAQHCVHTCLPKDTDTSTATVLSDLVFTDSIADKFHVECHKVRTLNRLQHAASCNKV